MDDKILHIRLPIEHYVAFCDIAASGGRPVDGRPASSIIREVIIAVAKGAQLENRIPTYPDNNALMARLIEIEGNQLVPMPVSAAMESSTKLLPADKQTSINNLQATMDQITQEESPIEQIEFTFQQEEDLKQIPPDTDEVEWTLETIQALAPEDDAIIEEFSKNPTELGALLSVYEVIPPEKWGTETARNMVLEAIAQGEL